MKQLIIVLLIACPFWTYAQNESSASDTFQQQQEYQVVDSLVRGLSAEMELLSKEHQRIKKTLSQYSSDQSDMRLTLDTLTEALEENKVALSTLQSETKSTDEALKEDLQITEREVTEDVAQVESASSRRVLYLFGAFVLLLLGGIWGYRQLKYSLTDSQAGLLEKIKATRNELETEAIRLDEKLVEVMENQLALIKAEREHSNDAEETEIDHSLALKVADEIVRIEKNISRMDEDTKGLKQLSKAVGRIKDNFAANGYEMVELIGKKYDDGMKLIANFRPDDGLKPGERIITRIIKPQVNYNGRMIQSAQVEVSQG